MPSPFLRPLLIGLLLLGSSAPLKAVAGSWSSLGPDGGPVTALASPVGSPNVIYAGVFGGVFKSVDGGATWKSASRGLDLMSAVGTLAIDPLHPSTLYAGTSTGFRGTETSKVGVFKSVDGGATWKPAVLGLDVLKIVIHPRLSQTIFATTAEGLYQSTNGGGKWRLLSKGLPRGSFPFAFTIDPTSPHRMFGEFLPPFPAPPALFKSLDGGYSWQPVQSDLQNIETLAIDPRSPKTIYASRSIGNNPEPSGLFRSTNEGRNWTECFVSGDSILSLAFPPTQKNLVYAGGLPGIYRSSDSGVTWIRLGFPAEAHSLLVSSLSASTLIVGAAGDTQSDGIYKSTDGGGSWTRSDRGLAASKINSLALDAQDSNTLWTIADQNIFKSTDRGQTWSPLLVDPEIFFRSVQRITVSPADPDIAYAARENGEILRSRDGGQTWTTTANRLDEGVVLTADPLDAATVWAIRVDAGISKSTDGGDTWTAQPEPAAGGFFFDLVFSRSSPSIVYAGGSNDAPLFAKALVLRSADAGAHWTIVQEGGDLPGFHVATLAVDLLQPETVYSVTDSNGDIYKTVDGGSNWSVASNAFHDRTVQFLAAGLSGALYAAVQYDNVYESEDGGLTWSPLGAIPKPFSATSLAADPADPCRVYAGTEDRGLLAFTKTGTAVCP